MPSYNRARQYNRSGGLAALLEGILGYFGETGIAPNDAAQMQGPTPSGDPISKGAPPFKATNWLARPNVNALNNQYLMEMQAADEQYRRERDLTAFRTDEQVRGRKAAFPIREQEQEADFGRTERGKVLDFGRAEKGKVSAQQQAVLQALQIPVSDDNIALVNNILTEPRVAKMLQEIETGTATSMAGLEQLKQGEKMRLENADADSEIAGLERKKSRLVLEGDIDVLPSDLERRKKMNRYGPEAVRTGTLRESLFTVPEGGAAFDIYSGQPKLQNQRDYSVFGGTTPTAGGGYTGKATQNTPDTVTNTQTPVNNKSDWKFDPATGEAVNVVTGKRIKLNP